ncbi:hypothetical protein HHK36_019058 [Tetracentron sinense]|uniref:ENTH domain-containing protein n=1 Tax=Tetracentron sinense TaxID=13715 RepID=A0A835DBV6_TETSI|nr:hypothetical protein HHK36_019058 [Tetracentron sinense]
MSILRNNNSSNMGTPFFHDFKRQASFFLKEKIKTARLALTDVTAAELLTEEATNGTPYSPDTQTMGLISRAAFEVDDYWRIVEILHKRLLKFDRKNWRVSYKALILLEHLLTHGPESVAEEFQSDKDVIQEMGSFQYIDERGFNWGLTVTKKSERILKLLEKGLLLKEERDQARKLTRGIEGFGSFSQHSSANRSLGESSLGTFGRCNSNYNDNGDQENEFRSLKKGDLIKATIKNPNTWYSFSDGGVPEKSETGTSLKENIAPTDELIPGELHDWNCTRESKPLLGGQKDELKIGCSMEDHPFNDTEHQTTASLLSTRDEILQGCRVGLIMLFLRTVGTLLFSARHALLIATIAQAGSIYGISSKGQKTFVPVMDRNI